MMKAAAVIALEKPGDRGIFAERTQNLDLGVVQFDEDDRHAVRRQILRRRNAGAESIAIDRRRGFEVGYGNGDMVQPTDNVLASLSGFARAFKSARGGFQFAVSFRKVFEYDAEEMGGASGRERGGK